MMNLKIVIPALLSFMTVNTASAQKTETLTLRVVETSDVHGCFFPYDFIERRDTRGSLARVSSYVKRLRGEYGDNLILLDNGDILQGQPTCYYYNYVASGEQNIVSQLLNYMRYDAAAVGNHDIETGHAVYDKWLGEMKCPMLGANIIDTKTGRPYLKPYTIIERQGVKVAVLGMLTPAIPNWLSEDIWSGLRFEPIESSVARWMKYLRENERPDVIIGLFHSGWNGGIVTPEYTEDAVENVARQVEGFDLILFGHDHTARSTEVEGPAGGKVVCLDPSNNAINVADARIEITRQGGKVVGKKVSGEVHDITAEPVDEAYMAQFAPQMKQVENFIGSKVGEITETMYTRDCFFGSAPFTDLIHNLQLEITGADVSLNAPLQFNTSLSKGDIMMSDMFKLYKYENLLCVLRMTGEEIRRHLEMSYCLWTNTMTTQADHIMLLDARNKGDMQKYGFKNMTFNFDSAAGINYEVDVTKPAGQKVRILSMADGTPFSPQKWYRVAMNSYRANGGGELLTRGAGIPKDSLEARIVYKSDRDLRHYLAEAIRKQGVITPKANNNWRFVPERLAAPALKSDRKLIFGE